MIKIYDFKAELENTSLIFVKPKEPIMISSRELRVKLVLCNLLQNAIKFARGGNVVVLAETVNNTYAKVTVIDDGTSIPEHK